MMKSLARAAIASANGRGGSYLGVTLQVFGRDRLLDPMQVVGREPLNSALCLGGIERLVEIHHQGDVGPDQIAHPPHDTLVIGEIAVAALDLDAAKTPFERSSQHCLVLVRVDDAVAVVGPDRPRRTA
jgi:hypothetical protein